MNRFQKLIKLLSALALVYVLPAQNIFACAACYGKSDSPMAWGMNAGILTLLVIVGLVLGSIAGFFVFIVKRSAKLSADQNPNHN